MVTVQVLVQAWLIVTLVNVLILTIGKQDTTVIRSSDGDYFTNPDETCNINSCNSYNSTIVGGHCVSSDECCIQCRCDYQARTYVVHAKQCMSLDEIRKHKVTQTTEVIEYLLGKPEKSCSETCNDLGSVCLAKGHEFTDFKTTLSIFRSVNVSCKAGPFDTDKYRHLDQPAYVIESALGGWAGRCIGFKNVSDTIDCTARGSYNIRRLCPCKVIVYHLGKPEKSCSETCNDLGSVCLAKAHGFTDFKTTLSIFRSVNVGCLPGSFDTDTYRHPDQPAYVIESALGGWAGRCIGFKNVSDIIDCIARGSYNIRRLCPCKGYGDCRYWFVEHNGGYVDPSSYNIVPVLDLSTKGSIRLSICSQGSMPTNDHLSKCTVEEVTYMRGSQWVPFGDDANGALEVTDQQSASGCEGVVLKWDSSLGNTYNGIIGVIEVKCNEKRISACFVFKSNGSRTSQHLVTTETTQRQSTPSTPVATDKPTSQPLVTTETNQQQSTPSTPVATGEFDKKKGSNGSSTTIVAAVITSVLLLIIICVITILVIRRRRRQSDERTNEIMQSNPTYGKGPDDTLMFRETGGAMGKDGEGKRDSSNSSTMQNTYEVVGDEAVDKRNNSNIANPVLNSDTYETIDTANEPTYHYADPGDVVRQVPKRQPIYSLLEETNKTQQDNVYNVLAKPEQHRSDSVNSENVSLYNVLKRDPIS